MTRLSPTFFDREVTEVAREFVGKVLRRRWQGRWLAAAIVETEAYSIHEKGSHASLGRTPSREALWGPPGTLYLYYSRGGDSLNVSCGGGGDAVLIKSGRPWTDDRTAPNDIELMRRLNPIGGSGSRLRSNDRLCSGQVLLCRSLALKVPEWSGRHFDDEFFAEDVAYRPASLIQTTRLGIPVGRDERRMWRFVDVEHARSATSNPLTKRAWTEGQEYRLIAGPDPQIRERGSSGR